ncbi:sensor histidine kinase [Xylophilus sp. Leaf220]|uniref:sensor histidine kinase n=1 Tax=Xylophilus sp. Leaf220 TaxID=1735686 RepID=UPI0006F8050D|nr:histidine kinase [Xylophilus sp. Leaf220]KQM76411.1 hypothetical protein ASE76_18815 [Xylophilus sp. Leaf220]
MGVAAHPAPEGIARLRRGLQTWAFCLAISSVQVFVDPAKRYLVELVYSLSIGTACWLLAELSRQVLRRPTDPGGWPHDWRGAVLFVFSVAGGFLVGTLLADAWFGWSSWDGHGDVKRSVAVTAVAGFGITYFFHSRGRAAHLEAAAREAARTATESRLKLLETQLEPHMLFNTLANLQALVATDPPRAGEMLDHLIAYLRATLGGSRATLHPLQAEFARVGDYLALMQIRMGGRLAFALDLPGALGAVPVPPLLLQPLVENAIRHGLEPQVEGGRIDVSARTEGQGAQAQLLLEVRDTGIGLPAAAALPQAGSGFGTAQVRERLAALYGSAGAIEIIANGRRGTLASVRFPLHFEHPQEPPAR